ncbi:MAG: hypothetical protein ACRCSF_06700 [Mycobacteriaceae bacterium]
MIYILAAIGAIALAILLWRAFGPTPGNSRSKPITGPDDDPEFLWRIGRNKP